MFIILFGVVFVNPVRKMSAFRRRSAKTAQRHIDIRAEVDIICIK